MGKKERNDEKAGLSREEVARKGKERGGKLVKEIVDGVRRKEKEERKAKIENSKYNEIYKKIQTDGIPEYLKGRRGKKERSMIARFTCGNETRGTHIWREEEMSNCRVCGTEKESLEHVVKECEKTKDEMTVEEFLREDGKGKEVMERISKARRERMMERVEEGEKGKEGEAEGKEAMEEEQLKGERGERESGKQCSIT